MSDKNIDLCVRWLICCIWLPTGVYQIFNFQDAINQITNNGIPLPWLVAVLTIAMKIVGTILVLMNRWVKEVMLVWIAFVLVATPIFHADIILEGKLNTFHFVQTLKNLAIVGGMLAYFQLVRRFEVGETSQY
ncbi:DoxX family protein [uncultured Pseudoteredinibacter sp.]|uniref:DoxX family protein n=1 Tax=uncultured Pseudoteredinibacter sp. TaxID=1641701 RepID=UPI00261A2ECC|nr:DoxX family protein [uncultured Pseudoteredinibacter sp.]